MALSGDRDTLPETVPSPCLRAHKASAGADVAMWEEPPTPTSVREIYLDDALLVIDKPAGLPVHPSSRYLHGTVVGRLRERYGDHFAAAVHRIDRETSGVLVCARHTEAARCLSRQFGDRAVVKEYLAVCEGRAPRHPQGLWVTAPIASGGPRIRIGVRCDPLLGKPASTYLEPLASFRREGEWFSLWRAWPRTGRRHQVRVHLRHAGWPLVGDKIYGPDDRFYEDFAAGALTREAWLRLRLSRQALHASALTLRHPMTGERVRFAAPLPRDLLTFMGSDRGGVHRERRHGCASF